MCALLADLPHVVADDAVARLRDCGNGGVNPRVCITRRVVAAVQERAPFNQKVPNPQPQESDQPVCRWVYHTVSHIRSVLRQYGGVT